MRKIAMCRTIAIATFVAVALGIAGAFAATDSKPTDPQIAHIAYTAGVLDVEAGKQALDKSKNEDVRAFAQRMVGDHTSVNDQAIALVKKLNVTPEDNPTSKALTQSAEAKRKTRGPSRSYRHSHGHSPQQSASLSRGVECSEKPCRS
jgi:putative membrane protein